MKCFLLGYRIIDDFICSSVFFLVLSSFLQLTCNYVYDYNIQ